LWRLDRLVEARQRLSEAEQIGMTLYTELMDARLCIAEGKSEEAVRKLNLFLVNHTEMKRCGDEFTYAAAQGELGRLLVDLERYPEAIDPLEGALSLSTAHGDRRKVLCFYLGICHFKNEQWDAAKEKFIQSLPSDRRHPWWAQAQYYLGICDFETGNLKAAEQKLIQSLPDDRNNPLWSKVQYQLGRVYFNQGAYLKAQKTFEVCEFFVGDAEIRKSISEWLRATQTKLREEGQPRA
jgi:tetratricopeptide (TPR) repeat protein